MDRVSLFSKARLSERSPQIFAAFTASLGTFAHGLVSSWSSTAIPSLLQEEQFSKLTVEDQSWIISLAPLAAFITAPFLGISIDYLGRKVTMIIQALLLIVGFSITTFSLSFELISVGRCLQGFFLGISMAFACFAPVVYISEISESDIRGTLNSFGQVMIAVGDLCSYTLGSFLSWRPQTFYSTLPPLLYLALLIVVPESPRFLLSRNKTNEAFAALCWLRGTKSIDDVREELGLIHASLEETKKEGSWILRLKSQNAFKPLMIAIGLIFFQETFGLTSIMYFSVTIFEAAGTLINPYLSTVLIGVTLVIAASCASIFMDSTGRRPLLIASGISSSILLNLIGLYFFLKSSDIGSFQNFEWLSLVLILLFLCAYGSGWFSAPWLIMSEILPISVIGIVSGFITSMKFFVSFLISKYFNVLAVEIGMQWEFWIFSIFGFLATIFVFFCVPETKLKTLEEIQVHLKRTTGDSKKDKEKMAFKNGDYHTFE